MRGLFFALCLAFLPIAAGCTHNHFNLPQDSVADSVKVLGVVPIIVDTDSDIRFPQKDELAALLASTNRKHEKDLLRLLKNTNSFYTVTTLDLDPGTAFRNMFFRRERRDDAAVQYNKYFWKEDALADLMRKNNLDALMFVVVSGITRPDKITSSNFMDSLEAEYNFLIMTAQIVDSKGTVLWEYPNFRKRSITFTPFMNLQYPAFDEAKANMNAKINLKFKTLEGIKAALEKRKKDMLMRETQDSEIYITQFEDMTSLIDIDRSRKPAQPAEPQKSSPATEQPVKSPVKEAVKETPKEPVKEPVKELNQ